MKKAIIILFAIIGILKSNLSAQTNIENKKNQYCADSITAIKIAEAVWLPRYGKRIYKKKPFTATSQNDSVWVVKGTLHSKKGGVPNAKIQKNDCKVLEIYFDK